MVRVLLLVILLAAAAAPLPASAQGFAPTPPSYATSPGSTSVPPVQQQVLENYRSQLQQTQREMLQQNPSGLSPPQIEVGRQLNIFNAVPPTTYSAAPPPAPSHAPPAAYYAAPALVDAPPPTTRHAARHPAPRHSTHEPAASR